MYRMFLTTAAAATLATAGFAGEFCEIDGSERFVCTFKNGQKAVEVCDAFWLDDDHATYGFFIPGQETEMDITQDMTTMVYQPWNGMGNPPWASVTFRAPNSAYAYTVWYEGDDGGITVQKNDEDIATLNCDPGSLTHDLDALIERIETAQISP